MFLLQQLFQREADLGIYQADCEAGLQDPRFVPRAVTFDDNNLVSVADEDGEDTDADASWEEDSYQETGDLEEKQVRKSFCFEYDIKNHELCKLHGHRVGPFP